MNIIKNNENKNIESIQQNIYEGKNILKENIFFKDFTNLMRNQEFKKFYNEYFNDWSDIQTMIFYMKLYSIIEDLYFKRYNSNISDELMTYTLHKIITTKETRQLSMKLFRIFQGKEDKLTISDKNELNNLESMINFDLLLKQRKNKLYIEN